MFSLRYIKACTCVLLSIHVSGSVTPHMTTISPKAPSKLEKASLVPTLQYICAMKRLLHILLIFALVTSAFAQDTPGLLESYARVCVDNAAGWGAVGTPMILATAGTFHEFLHSQRTGDKFDRGDVFGFVQEGHFWKGLLGCVALSYAASLILPVLPLGPFLTTMFSISAGFIGAELGQGTIDKADWTSISLQVLAATTAYFAFNSLLAVTGITLGAALLPALTATVCIISALTTAFFLDRYRQQEDVNKEKATINSPLVNYSHFKEAKDYANSYEKLLTAGRRNDNIAVEQALADYRQAHYHRQLQRSQ